MADSEESGEMPGSKTTGVTATTARTIALQQRNEMLTDQPDDDIVIPPSGVEAPDPDKEKENDKPEKPDKGKGKGKQEKPKQGSSSSDKRKTDKQMQDMLKRQAELEKELIAAKARAESAESAAKDAKDAAESEALRRTAVLEGLFEKQSKAVDEILASTKRRVSTSEEDAPAKRIRYDPSTHAMSSGSDEELDVDAMLDGVADEVTETSASESESRASVDFDTDDSVEDADPGTSSPSVTDPSTTAGSDPEDDNTEFDFDSPLDAFMAAADAEDPDMKARIEEETKRLIAEDDRRGNPIGQDVCGVFDKMIAHGVSTKKATDLNEKYLPPRDVLNLGVPQINKELGIQKRAFKKDRFGRTVKDKDPDEYLKRFQRGVVKAMIPIMSLIKRLVKKDKKSRQLASDAFCLLAQVNKNLNKERRFQVIKRLNKTMKHLAHNTRPDGQFLFGQDVTTAIKECNTANKENKMQDVISWPGPRTVIVPRAENGFGFTLRHFIVYPPDSTGPDDGEDDSDNTSVSSEGARNKRSKLSGLDPMDTIFVKQVKEGGPAHQAGLQKGDRIVSVNGESVTGKTYSQVIGLIQGTDSALQLLVVPKDEDVLQMAYESSAYNQGREPHKGRASDIPLPPTLSDVTGTGRDGEPAPHPSKPPVAPGRFRSELHVPSDENQKQQRRARKDGSDDKLYADALRAQQIDPRFMIPGQRMSTSSIGSISSSGSFASSKEQHLITGEGKSRGAGSGLASTNIGSNPVPPTRTSSRNITLAHTGQSPQMRSGSLESISRSSDSSGSRHQSLDSRIASRSAVPRDPGSRASYDPTYSGHFGSEERLLRTSHEKPSGSRRPERGHHHHHLSSDDLIGHGFPVSPGDGGPAISKSITTGRLPNSQSPHVPPPYTRAHTTSSLLSPASGSARPKEAHQPGRVLSDDEFDARLCSTAQSQPSLYYAGREHGKSGLHLSRQPLSENKQNVALNPHEKLHRLSDNTGVDTYGLKISTKKRSDMEKDHSKAQSLPSSRHSVPERPMINLVTERMRKFESSDAVDSITSGSSWRHHSRINRVGYSKVPVPTKVGYDSVASRTAHFEQWMDELDGGSSEDLGRVSGRVSADSSARESPVPQSRPPPDIRKVPATPPATINFYFRGETPTDSIKLEPSPERTIAPPLSPKSGEDWERRSSHDSQSQGRSPQLPPRASQLKEGATSPGGSKKHKTALRQASYLSAINAPNNQSARPTPYHPDHDNVVSNAPYMPHQMPHPKIYMGLYPASDQSMKLKPPSGQTSMRLGLMSAFNMMAVPVMNADPMPPNSSCLTTGTITSTTTTSVKLRQQQTAEEREQKLKRRTSYLMATGKHHLTINTDRQGSPQPPPTSPSMGRKTETRAIFELTVPILNSKAKTLDCRLPSPQSPITPTSGDPVSTPPKTSNIKKLKAFFGEKTSRSTSVETPRIQEATAADRKYVFDLPSPLGDVEYEGALNCKMAVTDGKRANDRSWKPVWAVLRGHALYLYKDKTNISPTSCDEQPISVKSSIVDIAYDYTKKKNVFRLTTYNGSEYLFQADDRDVMLQWINTIQSNNNPDEDKEGVTSSELIMRKTEQMVGASPQPSLREKEKEKDKKKTSTRSLRSKSPASHSPATKPKKYTDHSDSPKTKDSKTWKGKMAKKFKRYGSSSSQSVDTPEPSVEMMDGTFGIPLEMCVPSCSNEHVPQIVELCAGIVEARGLENQGIYRVPGNTSAVNNLQSELDRDPESVENVDTESDKWMDVNVVSSLLKLFFRKLPDPLITDELYENVINANKTENPERRMLKIKKILHDLPDHNFETFRYLALHLKRVAMKGDLNKMDGRNLAIVFGPTLVRPQEDSMVTMVRDMSDQCRIVESIISHAEWFFSSWDEDVNVPVDEVPEGAIPVSGMNKELLVKAENLQLGDRGRDTSAKDLVSSIISAANKKVKIRKKDKSRTYDSLDLGIESEPSSYNERNIDAEIELRQLRQQMSESVVVQETSSNTSTIAAASSLQQMSTLSVQESAKTSSSSMTNLSEQRQKEGIYSAKVVYVKPEEHNSSVAMRPNGNADRGSCNQAADLKRYPAYPNPEATALNVSTDNSKSTLVRKPSQENLLEKKPAEHQHDEVNHQRSTALTLQTKQQLRKLDIETKVLRQKEQERVVEQQKLAMSKQRIEMELKRTQEELEKDELEELMNRAKDQPEFTSKYSNLMSSSAIETTSVTSDYSTNSSANITYEGKFSTGALMSTSTPSSTRSKNYMSDYSSTDSPASQKLDTSGLSSHAVTPKSGHIQRATVRRLDTSSGGKYFVTGTATPPSHGKHAADDLALHTPTRSTPHFDTRRVAHKGTLQKKRKKSGVTNFQVYDVHGASPLNTQMHTGDMEKLSRKGSLDSLLDLHNTSYVDSDSSEDLLREIASADQRFKDLLSPKSCDAAWTRSTDGFDQAKRGAAGGFDQAFRDPSLHRLQQERVEPIVGIASRFERGDQGDYNGAGVREFRLTPSGRISKAQKTDANLSKQQRIESEEYALAIRKSTERLYLKDSPSSPVKSNMPNILLLQHKSKSASPAVRKRENKRGKPRRHTVGGTDDVEHFKALMSLRQNQGDSQKPSAWERLRPNVTEPDTSDNPNMKAWIQQQRMKHAGSSPALYEPTLGVTSGGSPSAYNPSRSLFATVEQSGAGTPLREYRGMFRPNSPGNMSTSSSSTSQSGSTRGRLTFESAI